MTTWPAFVKVHTRRGPIALPDFDRPFSYSSDSWGVASHETSCLKILQGALRTGSFVTNDMFAFQMNQEHRKALRMLLHEAGLSEFILCEESNVWSEVNEGLLSWTRIKAFLKSKNGVTCWHVAHLLPVWLGKRNLALVSVLLLPPYLFLWSQEGCMQC